VIRSVMQRVRNKFGISIAEVAENDAWQVAVLGVACVSNDARHAQDVLREVESYVRDSRLDAEVINVETDVIDMGE
jgi:uncharacterized protein YlxP (DUF503 family)